MILLDTHLWWVNQEATLLRAEWVQSIELSMPIAEWFTNALESSGIALVSLTPSIATVATSLPYHHRDPQDRLIMATAIEYQTQLASADAKFAQHEEVRPLLV